MEWINYRMASDIVSAILDNRLPEKVIDIRQNHKMHHGSHEN